MYPFLESIRLENGQLHFMQGHEARFTRTQQDNWGRVIYKDVEKLIMSAADLPTDNGKYKCRILYSPDHISIQFLPYTPRVLSSLQPVFNDIIDYRYKSTDRRFFEKLMTGTAHNTEILIFKQGLLTDSSFSNLALREGNDWYTPKTPLLNGVHRSHLLNLGILKERDIAFEALQQFSAIRLINVMMDWEDTWEIDMSGVLKA